MKKFLILGAALALGVSAVSAQQKQDTIVVYGAKTFDPSTPTGAYLQSVARLFESQNPGIKVQLNYGSWGDLWKKVGVMLANRQGPDLVVGPREYLLATGRGAGNWEDVLTVPDDKFLSGDARKGVGPAILEASRFPGRPGFMVWPWEVYLTGSMVANADMLKAAGVDYKKIQKEGWDTTEFQRIAKAVTKGGVYAATYGPMGGHNGDFLYQTALNTNKLPLRVQPHGGNYTATYVDIKTGECRLDTEGFLKGYQLIRAMLDAGTIPKNTVGISVDESRDAFVTGKTAFSFDGPELVNFVDDRNRKIANGAEKGTPVTAVVLPRPRMAGANYQPYPMTIRSYGYYSFKQNPYKGDEHTENVFKFAKFFSDAVFQTRLAYDNFTPPDARVYLGEQSWFPGIMGVGDNAKYVESLRKDWRPSLSVYLSMALTPEMQAALDKFEREVVQVNRDAVALGKTTPQQAVANLQRGLNQVCQQIPKGKRLGPDAAKLAKEVDDFAAEIGQPR